MSDELKGELYSGQDASLGARGGSGTSRLGVKGRAWHNMVAESEEKGMQFKQ